MHSLGNGTAGAEISSGSGPRQVRLIGSGEASHWHELMAAHHYLGTGGFRTTDAGLIHLPNGM
jgi:hypothetical protein